MMLIPPDSFGLNSGTSLPVSTPAAAFAKPTAASITPALSTLVACGSEEPLETSTLATGSAAKAEVPVAKTVPSVTMLSAAFLRARFMRFIV